MSIERNNNINLKAEKNLDARLEKVANVASLPDPNLASNFLPEGAEIYVIDKSTHFRKQDDPDNPGTFIWVNTSIETISVITTGTISITPTTTILDLSAVSPAIEYCDEIIIDVVGGPDKVTLNSMINLPADKEITLKVTNGNDLVLTHTDYAVAGAGAFVSENGFDVLIKGRLVGDESISFVLNNGANVQTAAVQYTNADELPQIAELIGLSQTVVTDDFNETSVEIAASAYLTNDLWANKAGKIVSGGDGRIEIISETSDSTVLDVAPQDYGRVSSLGSIYQFENVDADIRQAIVNEWTAFDIANGNNADAYDFYCDLRPAAISGSGFWFIPAGSGFAGDINDTGAQIFLLDKSDTTDPQFRYAKYELTPSQENMTWKDDRTYLISMDSNPSEGTTQIVENWSNGSGGVGMSFQLTPGIYQIDASVKVKTNKAKQIKLRLLSADALAPDYVSGAMVTPLPNYEEGTCFSPTDSNTTDTKVNYQVSEIVQVSTPGDKDVFMLELSIDFEDFTSSTAIDESILYSQGALKIVKIK